ncbi:FAD-dependent oxidoreductase [Chromobacterium sp. ATCC 53434]|uniref:D-arabinono-1,4-lactone oxidase n=1 Tax=Chromobacterium sp. (strain ATCC 53434 / SC 14030) TaxID=2059672 RepID=UPI000C76413D|nr:D-arabinono-1,4-lactone oxidase [Chromobacterium sp. ATCC 53434]AUH52376.1 FAD-dependent oxidoreductase [Chromobacterium sp. ATCC 53434]
MKTTLDRRVLLRLGGGALLGAWTVRSAGPRAAAPAGGYRWRNWSGLQSCTAQALATPGDEAELARLLRAAGAAGTPLRCVGAGHSFTPLVPTAGKLVSLDRMSGLLAQDAAAGTATLLAGTRIAQLARQLDQHGLALRNQPDIDAQSYAGAISTATHGTGARLQALHADALALRLVTPAGEIVDCGGGRDDDLLQAARVSLGSLGVIARATIAVVPAYYLKRKLWLMPAQQMLDAAPELARTHRNFEFYYLPFTGYAAAIVHDLAPAGPASRPESQDEDMLRELRRLRDWLGKMPSLRRWVAQKLIDPGMGEQALDKSWRLLSTSRPTRFNETECHVPREAGIACAREVIARLERRDDVFFPMEFRFVQGDDAWLSPFYRRDSCSIAVHAAAGEACDYLVTDLAPIFRKYQGRPHWGKLHAHRAADFAALYPRWNDFLKLRRELDPRGLLLNPHLRGVFGVAT